MELSPPSSARPEEPLVESAPLAYRMAQTLCAPDPLTHQTCAWYHGLWQYLRVMGIVEWSGGQIDFLLESLGALARAGIGPRVLVSGSADYALPAHVLFAYARARAPVTLTVVDLCETPLALNRWYAERLNTTLVTARSDVLTYETSTAFDVIMANSFLGRFDAAARPVLAATWRRLLRPGGKVILTNRLRPSARTSAARFSHEQVQEFGAAVRREAERWQTTFVFDPDEVAGWARTYAERYETYPVASLGEIRSWLDAGGFTVDHVETVRMAARLGAGLVSGTGTVPPVEYARVIATRR